MNLDQMLDRCRDVEHRSAALYRSFAAGARDEPDLRVLWTALARQEDARARLLDEARRHLPTVEAWVTDLSARWDQVMRDVEAKLSEAERLPGDADTDQRLAAAIELEMTDIEPLRQMLVSLSRRCPPRPIAQECALRLADAVERFSAQPKIRQRAARLRARAGA